MDKLLTETPHVSSFRGVNDQPDRSTPRHPIRVVTTRTGLSPDLLRAWERRYRVVIPTRSAGGQRLYSDADIDRLRLLHRATQAGRSISNVAELSSESLDALVYHDSAPVLVPGAPTTDTPAIIDTLTVAAVEAITLLDQPGFERLLRRAATHLSGPHLLDGFIAPLLWRIGHLWEAGRLSPVHEHFASAEIRRMLSNLIERAPLEAAAPVIALATPAGQLIELGAMLAAATAANEGWRVIYFGPDLPAAEIVLGAKAAGAKAVAVSIVHESPDSKLPRELERMARGLKGHAALLVGGRAATNHGLLLKRLGALTFSDLDSFRHWLQTSASAHQLGARRPPGPLRSRSRTPPRR